MSRLCSGEVIGKKYAAVVLFWQKEPRAVARGDQKQVSDQGKKRKKKLDRKRSQEVETSP